MVQSLHDVEFLIASYSFSIDAAELLGGYSDVDATEPK